MVSSTVLDPWSRAGIVTMTSETECPPLFSAGSAMFVASAVTFTTGLFDNPPTRPLAPKCIPRRVTSVPPRYPPSAGDTLVMTGGWYDTTVLDEALSWPPTVTDVTKSRPTPAGVVHSIAVWFVVITHESEAYRRPSVFSRFASSTLLYFVPSVLGPKLLPCTVTLSPPRVDIVNEGLTIAVIDGAP